MNKNYTTTTSTYITIGEKFNLVSSIITISIKSTQKPYSAEHGHSQVPRQPQWFSLFLFSDISTLVGYLRLSL